MPQLQESTRQEVLKRDNRRCRFCGVTEQQHKDEHGRSLDIHHVIPRSADGSNHPENLIPVCKSCHQTIESTQADALERIKEKQNNKPSEFDKVAQEKERLACENYRKSQEVKNLKRQIDEMYNALEYMANRNISHTIYVVHETELTTSNMIYAGADEEKAHKAFRESENHATMESVSVRSENWIGYFDEDAIEVYSGVMKNWVSDLSSEVDE